MAGLWAKLRWFTLSGRSSLPLHPLPPPCNKRGAHANPGNADSSKSSNASHERLQPILPLQSVSRFCACKQHTFSSQHEHKLQISFSIEMAPPPRPPVICYDLYTNPNARKSRREIDLRPGVVRRSNIEYRRPTVAASAAKFCSSSSSSTPTNGPRTEEKPSRQTVAPKAKIHITSTKRPIFDTYPRTPASSSKVVNCTPKRAWNQHQPRVSFRQPPISENNSPTSSSTVSISSCDSPPNHLDEDHIDGNAINFSHQIQEQQQQQQPVEETYEHDTLEVSDMAFFEKVEDQTMIEVGEMMKRFRSTLQDLRNI